MILRVCLCIPTYNNPLTIAEVLDEALRSVAFPVLVIDDGSETPVAELLSAAAQQALKTGRLSILRHEVNQGKGAALRSAMHEAVAKGFTHLMAMDGDGQHHVTEVEKMVQLAKKHPWDLIIGNRKLKSATVPGISKFGRKFSNFWVQFQTGTTVADSQSGFRLYPLFFCQNLKFWSKRYDFEIEILIRLMWKGVKIQETEIEVFYPEKNERVSHFDKLWDNVHISVLNTFFVVVSLLRTHKSPRELSIATGAGVFIGCTPFFGLHTALVALVSFAFRLNAGALWLGSQISIPPLAPFLILGSVTIGHFVVSIFNPELAAAGIDVAQSSFREFLIFGSSHLLEWLLGSLILGAGLGFVTTALTYLVAKRVQKKAAPTTWTGRTRGGKFGNGFVKLVLKHLNVRAGYFCLLFIIPYFYLFAPKARRSLNEFWRVVSPEGSWLYRQTKIIHHLYRFGQILMDRIAQGFSEKPLFEIRSTGVEPVSLRISQKQPVIFLTSHVGGWDLSMSQVKHRTQAQFHAVEYRASGLTSAAIKNVPTIDSNRGHQPIFDIHALLAAGEPIGMMVDRPLTNRYELVPFFGKLAVFDATPFRVAAAARVPTVRIFGFKAVRSSYELSCSPIQSYSYDPERDRSLQTLDWVSNYAAALEAAVREHPDQWFNFFPFWSSLPTPPDDVRASKAANHLAEELRAREASGPAPARDPGPISGT